MTRKILLFLPIVFLFASCELEEGNQRGYVISKTHELPIEDSPSEN